MDERQHIEYWNYRQRVASRNIRAIQNIMARSGSIKHEGFLMRLKAKVQCKLNALIDNKKD